MRRRAAVLTSAGVLFCMIGGGLLLSTAPARAQSLPDRPALTPTPARPQDREDQAAAPTGRITGTVIDATTGAPVPGIPVLVGGVTVVTDANGNYDRSGLPAGSYSIVLALPAGAGTPEQDTMNVTLADGGTVIQHLRFRSPAVVAAAPIPESLPPTGGGPPGMGLLVLGVALLACSVMLRRRVAGS